jgi:hypothetical protein
MTGLWISPADSPTIYFRQNTYSERMFHSKRHVREIWRNSRDIAYSLKLLEEKPHILATIGKDHHNISDGLKSSIFRLMA